MSIIPKWLVLSLAVVALIGFADSAYLTAEHIRGSVPPCAVFSGCENVLTSRYAVMAGIPVPVLGMLYYGTVLVLLLAYADTGNRTILHLACWLTGAGFLGSLYFVAVQAFLVKAWCPYCLLSALTSTLLFLLAIRIMRRD